MLSLPVKRGERSIQDPMLEPNAMHALATVSDCDHTSNSVQGICKENDGGWCKRSGKEEEERHGNHEVPHLERLKSAVRRR